MKKNKFFFKEKMFVGKKCIIYAVLCFVLSAINIVNAQSCSPVFNEGNLVANPSFSGDFVSMNQWDKGWTNFDPKSSVDACGDGSGSLYIKANCYPNGGVLTFNAGKAIVPGQRYRILAKFKNETAANSDVFNIVLPNSVWNLSDNDGSSLDQHLVAIPNGAGWVQFDQTITAGLNAAGNLKFLIMSCDSPNLGTDSDFLYLDDFQVYPVESDGSLTILPDTGAIVSSLNDTEPLVVYNDKNYGGTSQRFGQAQYRDLGNFDNKIKSFILKKGFMATFASNSDGSGYSRVFTAQENDILVQVMPIYLNETVSFIRVIKLSTPNGNYVTKKGWAGWIIPEVENLNASWRYDWSANGQSSDKLEYVPIKQHLNWPGWDQIENKQNVTQVLGYNEPDRPDQSNLSNEVVIANWKYYMKSGLRIGSPAHSDPYNGLWGFMDLAEKNDFRVDFIAIHSYWSVNQQDWSWRLDNVYNAFKRPIWITEWNNGANWTTETTWPDANRLCTDANAQKQLNDLKTILTILESKPYVERYSFYNAVEDCRAVYLIIDNGWKSRNPNWQNYQWLKTAPVTEEWTETVNGVVLPVKKVLTPAGVYYRDLNSKKAYNPDVEYIPTWKPKVETLSHQLTSDFNNITIKWTGLNNDLVNKYIVERKLEGENDFTLFYESSDYSVISVNDVVHSKAEYRIKVVSKDNTETAYSSILTFTQDVIANPPTDLNGQAISGTIIDLTWSAVTGARGYNIKRSESIDGVYEEVVSYLTAPNFRDTGLDASTTYYYKISSSNSGGESIDSTPAEVRTLDLHIPDAVTNISVVWGDTRVKLQWNHMYDAQFNIKRSTSEAGPFEIVGVSDGTDYLDLTVSNGVTYYYKVSAFNEKGEGVDSDVFVANPDQGQKLTGTVIGHIGSYGNSGLTVDKAFDENLTTFVDAPNASGYVGYDFGNGNGANLTSIKYAPRDGYEYRMEGSEIRGSNSANYLEDYEVLYTISSSPTYNVLTEAAELTTKSYRYIYWYTPDGYGNIAELEFYGTITPFADDDNDGVFNYADQCPDTPNGDPVNTAGCFSLANNNFSFTQSGETCPGKNNGQISINATAAYNYIATINNVPYNFTNNSLVVSDLVPGTYSVCITIDGKSFSQCYTAIVPASTAITGKTVTTSDKLQVEIQSGTAPYNVSVNGVSQFETNEADFEVSVNPGDLLEVSTAKVCEGVLSKTITLYDVVTASPNPTSGQFDIYLPTNYSKVEIAIYSVEGKMISKSDYAVENGKVHLNIEKEATGVYLVRIGSNPVETIKIIKK